MVQGKSPWAVLHRALNSSDIIFVTDWEYDEWSPSFDQPR